MTELKQAYRAVFYDKDGVCAIGVVHEKRKRAENEIKIASDEVNRKVSKPFLYAMIEEVYYRH